MSGPERFSQYQEDRASQLELRSCVFSFQWQAEDEANQIQLLFDSDWAGCAVTRRSTSGVLLKLGTHILKTWSSTRAVVEMSSAVAELYAMTECRLKAWE